MNKDRKELIEELKRKITSAYDSSGYEAWQKWPYTAVSVCVQYKGCGYMEYGFAKVQHPDAWDADYGIELALRKACAAIARQILDEEVE